MIFPRARGLLWFPAAHLFCSAGKKNFELCTALCIIVSMCSFLCVRDQINGFC